MSSIFDRHGLLASLARLLKDLPSYYLVQDDPNSENGEDDLSADGSSSSSSSSALSEDQVRWVITDVKNGTGFAAIKWMTKNGRKPTDGSEHLSSHPCRNLEPLMTLFGLTECSNAMAVANILGFGALLIVLGMKRRFWLGVWGGEFSTHDLPQTD